MFRLSIITSIILFISICGQSFSNDLCWQMEDDGEFHAYISSGGGDIGTAKRKAEGYSARQNVGKTER